MRLAFVSPLPPASTGIADYAADLLELLAGRHEVDLFHAQEAVDATRLPAGAPLLPASELVARHRERPYDLAVYQMGNGRAHDFVYDVLSRVPGLLVLHDLVLHHARAAQFLESEAVLAWRRDPSSASARAAARPSLDAWRRELEYSYPGRGDRLFEAHLGTVGDLLPYAYPLFRIPVEASRAVAVHNAFMAAAIRAEVPGSEVVEVPQPARREPVSAERVRALRARLGFREDEVVVGSFGLVTPEKRTASLARAVARAAARDPRLRLLLVGPVPDSARLEALLARTGAAGRAVVTGRVPFEELAAHVEAADVVVHLRYPTARETSARAPARAGPGPARRHLRPRAPGRHPRRSGRPGRPRGRGERHGPRPPAPGRRSRGPPAAGRGGGRARAPRALAVAGGGRLGEGSRSGATAPGPAAPGLAGALAPALGPSLPPGIEGAVETLARRGVEVLELDPHAPRVAASVRARHAAPHAGVHVGPLAGHDEAQVQARLQRERDRRFEHQAAGPDVDEPRPDDEDRLREVAGLEPRGAPALHPVRPGRPTGRDHGTSRTTRKPKSAARVPGGSPPRADGGTSRTCRRQEPPRLTRLSPHSGPRGS